MDVPQPSSEPYSEGDRVRVYLGKDDHDSTYHNTKAIVVGRHEDNLNQLTDRSLDKFLYRLKSANTGEELPEDFRHRDLVPILDKDH